MDTLMNLTLGQILGSIAGIVVVLSIFIEITPIKVNPVSKFLGWIGGKTNKELNDKIKTLDDKLSGLEKDLFSIQNIADERNAINCRLRIIQFGDEIRREIPHSKENYDQVLSDIDEYDSYCREHQDFKNNKTVITSEIIKTSFAKRLDKNDFL